MTVARLVPRRSLADYRAAWMAGLARYRRSCQPRVDVMVTIAGRPALVWWGCEEVPFA